jgi:hypothetical protein
MAMTPEQKKNNLRMALILASVALCSSVGLSSSRSYFAD